MIDIKLSPPREGTRGGRDHFKWEDLKNQCTNERDYYLGHSVKIGVPKRRDYFYKHDWYLKPQSQESDDKVTDEVELVKLYEKIVMDELIGKRPKKLTLLKQRPTDPEQLRTLLKQVTQDDHVSTAPREPVSKARQKSHAKGNLGNHKSRRQHPRELTSSSRSSSNSSIPPRQKHRHKRNRRRDRHERDDSHYRRYSRASKSRSRSYSLNRRHRLNHYRERHGIKDHRRDEGSSRYHSPDKRARGPRD